MGSLALRTCSGASRLRPVLGCPGWERGLLSAGGTVAVLGLGAGPGTLRPRWSRAAPPRCSCSSPAWPAGLLGTQARLLWARVSGSQQRPGQKQVRRCDPGRADSPQPLRLRGPQVIPCEETGPFRRLGWPWDARTPRASWLHLGFCSATRRWRALSCPSRAALSPLRPGAR